VLTGLKDIASNTKLKETTRVQAYELPGKALGMFRNAIEITQKPDADPKKWTKEQLEQVIQAFEEQVGPEIGRRRAGSCDSGSAGN
jgi:hypothetical protein